MTPPLPFRMNDWSDDSHADRQRAGWDDFHSQNPCGRGSAPRIWRDLHRTLPELLHRYGIHSIVDAGAGTCALARLLGHGAYYRAYDLVPRRPEVQPWDIIKQVLPAADAIVCRHVMIHFHKEWIPLAIENFRLSRSTYLLASQYYTDTIFNPCTYFNRTDLREWLGTPLAEIEDFEDSKLALWRLAP